VPKQRSLAAAAFALAVIAAGAFLAWRPTAAAAEGEVAARLGTQTITLEQVDAKAKQNPQSLQVYQQLYQVRKAALDEIVADRLVEQEAKARGVTKEALLEQEVTSKIVAVSDADVEKFYNENRARMGGKPLEEMKDPIRQFLTAQNQQQARQAMVDRLSAKTKLEVVLDAPRVTVTVREGEPMKGPATAPITLVEYSEFQCPFCSRVGPTVQQVMKTYGDKVRLVFRDYPLPFHDKARPASEAAQCAHAQGKFWEYHDTLFANQNALDAESLKKHAADLGLDTAKFNQCFDEGRYKSVVERNFTEGQVLGVSGTPAFFINGRFLSGAVPFEAFQQIIDEELKRQGG
jgi:protein-disulfide isomerase